MPIFMGISRHSPENCGAFNEKARKATLTFMNKMLELLKKHGCKNRGMWVVPSEHLNIWVIEAPSLEAYQKLSMEPETLALMEFQTIDTKVLTPLEESMKLLQQQ